jgi:DnaJ-class molecular chaperone
MPIYRREGSHGDLIVTYSVTIPTTLTARHRELYEELQREGRRKRLISILKTKTIGTLIFSMASVCLIPTFN